MSLGLSVLSLVSESMTVNQMRYTKYTALLTVKYRRLWWTTLAHQRPQDDYLSFEINVNLGIVGRCKNPLDITGDQVDFQIDTATRLQQGVGNQVDAELVTVNPIGSQADSVEGD